MKAVLVVFDDDVDADRFVEETDLLTKGEVVAAFKLPTKFCECPPQRVGEHDMKRGRLKVGGKFGWLVCGECLRPRRGHSQAVENLLESAKAKYDRIWHLQIRGTWTRSKNG